MTERLTHAAVSDLRSQLSTVRHVGKAPLVRSTELCQL